jgi:hypothetical protein
VVVGNAGAFAIVCHLLPCPGWDRLLQHLKTQHVIGSKLWQVIKDDYDHDWQQFVNDQWVQMAPRR